MFETRRTAVDDCEVVDVPPSDRAAQPQKVLTPIEIAVHGDALRMRAGIDVEPREVIGVNAHPGEDDRQRHRNHQHSGARPNLDRSVRRENAERCVDREDVPHADVDRARHHHEQQAGGDCGEIDHAASDADDRKQEKRDLRFEEEDDREVVPEAMHAVAAEQKREVSLSVVQSEPSQAGRQ